MGGGIPQGRKSFTKIKNFTEKDQVRIKYSLLGKEKKPMLSVYIGEDVYNQLTDGTEYKRIKATYIHGDMVVITPTNDDKGLIHRYNGSGMFKTTCVRISLGKIKGLKLNKRDFTNRIVEYSILYGGMDEACNALRIDISNSKKIRFTLTPQDALDRDKKPILIGDFKDSVYRTKQKDRVEISSGIPDTVLTNTKADKKPNKETYIPRMDHKLDEINEKIDEIIKNKECLAEAIFSVHELLNNGSVRIKEKDEFESPDIDRRIAMLEARFSRLELTLENIKNKSLFEKIFGK